MKQNKIENFTTFFIILVLIAMMILSGITIIKKIIKKEQDNSSINVDYEKLFPFEADEVQTVKKASILKKYETIIEDIKTKIEAHTSEQLLGYEKFIELSYIYKDLMLYKLVSNSNELDRVDLGNGYLSQIQNEEDVDKCANNIIEFNKYLKENDITLLYVQAPYKISENQPMPSNIYRDYTNKNVNKFLKQINGKIDYLDLRKIIKQKKLDNLSLFYKTDHHWLPETGLWVAGEISKYLNNTYNLNLNIENINPDKYNIKIYPKMYLGYDGRYVSLKNAEPEDFDLITPKFNTRLNIKILNKGIDKTDSFENTLIDWSRIEYGNYYSTSQYGAYAYGEKPLIEIHNELVKNNKKILMIKDSFADVVSPFLALENEYLSIIDLRYYNGSLKSYIKSFNPSLVLIMYNGGAVENYAEGDETSNLAKVWRFE